MTKIDHAAKLAEACASAKALLINDLDEPGRTVFWKVTDALAAYQSDLAAPSPDPVREGLVSSLRRMVDRYVGLAVLKGAPREKIEADAEVVAARAALTRAGVE